MRDTHRLRALTAPERKGAESKGPTFMSSPQDHTVPAISVQNVGKCYHIYDRPQDRLKQSLWRGRRKFFREFWALREVSFEVAFGESVGIIGTNGSGKSTLLQIIAGTLMPSEGEARVNGRIAALLELGSGFNPEFTGRENVFMNGAILGLSQAEMERRFDEIAAFADIGAFLDQPVKTYSSGMYVRLAFSVAVSVEPDILIVDEALAVGDMQFQHKCIARIRRLMEAGTTLVFVSHDPETVKALCRKGIWLENGRVRMMDSARAVSQRYVESLFLGHNAEVLRRGGQEPSATPERAVASAAATLDGGGAVRVESVRILNGREQQSDTLDPDERFTIEVRLRAGLEIDHVSVGFVIKDYLGIDLTGESVFNACRRGLRLVPGQPTCVRFTGINNLRPGNYAVAVRVNRVAQWDREDNILIYNDDTAASFRVTEDPDRPIWFRYRHPFEVTIS
jgi:lipopolysaccharide transport system ATP-binding protein